MRNATQMSKNRCGASEIGLVEWDNNIKRVSYSLMKRWNVEEQKPCLCTDNMTLMQEHLNSMVRVHAATCQKCGKKPSCSVSCAWSMFALRVEMICLVSPVVLISITILWTVWSYLVFRNPSLRRQIWLRWRRTRVENHCDTHNALTMPLLCSLARLPCVFKADRNSLPCCLRGARLVSALAPHNDGVDCIHCNWW